MMQTEGGCCMTDLTPRAELRAFLERLILLDVLVDLNAKHGLSLTLGSTFYDALTSAMLKRAREGDREAAEIVKKYGLE